jgi:hypothetical protein
MKTIRSANLRGLVPAGCLLAFGLLLVNGCKSSVPFSANADARHTLRRGNLAVVIETAPADLDAKFGPRFDRTAVVRQVTLNGKSFLGELGLPDEFGINGDGVLGFTNAPVGGEFLKIGVGYLIRDRTNDYFFWNKYPVRKLLPITKLVVKKESLTVTQSSDHSLPWSYAYSKSYRLVADDTLEIDYTLTNTGTNAWSFLHYNHNWLAPEGIKVGPAYSLATGFPLPAGETAFGRSDHLLWLISEIPTNTSFYLAGDFRDSTAAQNRFTVLLHGKPLLAFAGDFAPARFAAYAVTDGFCPEMFFRAELPAGKSARWSTRYQFLTLDGSKQP